MTPVAPTFFVSYRREDAGYAEALRVALAARYGVERVFKDVDSMALGSSWKQQVRGALDRSTHVLALVGEGWMQGVDESGRVDGHTDPVVFELDEAFRRNLVVVPVLVGGREMPDADELPSALRAHDFWYLNAAPIRAESPGLDIAALVGRFVETDTVQEPAVAPVRAHDRRRVGAMAVIGGLVAVIGVAVVWLSGAFDDDETTDDPDQGSTETGLAAASEDGHPACADPSGPEWNTLQLAADPTGRVGDPGNELSFEVNAASWRSLGPTSWEVVVDTAMTNGTDRDAPHGSWHYDYLEVARRPFELSCISVADEAFVKPGLVGDGRVGFAVRCEPVGAVALVIDGADVAEGSVDSIELVDSAEPGGC